MVTNQAFGDVTTIQEGWDRLIKELEVETKRVKELGTNAITIVDFSDIKQSSDGHYYFDESIISKVRDAGSLVVRNVIPKDEARQLKYELDKYIDKYPNKRDTNKSMYHYFWTPSQLKARSHPNMQILQQALMSIWHSSTSGDMEVCTRYPLAFGDRFRIRPSGEKMYLGPHVDGGFIGTGDNKEEFSRVFSKIVKEGNWEDYDPFDFTFRLNALYNEEASKTGYGNAAFRMFQGWLSMSSTGPGGGTLQVNPMLKHASAYATLRPYFSSKGYSGGPDGDDPSVPWVFTGKDVFGGQPSRKDMDKTHPHLRLHDTMVSVPHVEPGDYVAWHCDTIHAVELDNNSETDASVLYIPAVPLTEDNLYYLSEQRAAFKRLGTTKIFQPDTGEDKHSCAGSTRDIIGENGLRSMGLGTKKFELVNGMTEGEKKIINRANALLFA
ncbi:hypothetical protein AWJ20_1908 [Sugiyamaella lignohabitans]|uniref:DUF1479-domain-containing protein n=1 Tax=Sugiyamaella lignohabitans TaxID=796027 RepID=A0A167E3W4_9ASCO|nr:uncharacterized protein AWJ20_1908 [Sugiyamaella lignohabitans]ANB13610.1 hypothetical protein AWJ20_1908 [Sugiyamaella lignohabitans]